jgi:hypothetical protein
MSSQYQNALYVPTGANAGEFITISGLCYKRVESNVKLINIKPRSDIVTGFLDCEDCNSCKCPKNIEFLMGGLSRNISTNQTIFEDIPIQITTSSTGWQEIAIESGFLNKNDPNLTFEPISIRCFDRKIDADAGIHIKFKTDNNANLGYFEYNSANDTYIRTNAFLDSIGGKYGDLPEWDYINIFDPKASANQIDTIKFKSDCDVDCNYNDIYFRIKGKVRENKKYLLETGHEFNSFVYADCNNIPQTYGQVVDCIPNSTGLNITEYFLGNFTGLVDGNSKPDNYKIEFSPTNIELVNKDLLLGIGGPSGSQDFSVTGSRHFRTFTGHIPDSFPKGHQDFAYLGDDTFDIEYSSGVGIKYKLDYNKPPFCFDESVYNSDFNSYYRHNVKSTNLSGCLQASEFADGTYKNGTYNAYYWSGTVFGNAQDYRDFIDPSMPLGLAPSNWITGGYVYQWYTSGEKSQPNSIMGYHAFSNPDATDSELHNHFKSMMHNSGPINTSNPLQDWTVKSGNFPVSSSEKVNFSISLSGDGNNYSTIISFNNSGSLRADSALSDLYNFNAPVLDNLTSINSPFETLANSIESDKIYKLTDSGNINNSPENLNQTINKEDVYVSNIKNLKFQLRWDKGIPLIKKQKSNLSINIDYSEYTDDALTSTDKAEISRAVRFYEKTIISDRILNLKVKNFTTNPQAPDGVLAYAGPTEFQEYRSGWFMTTVGQVAIDPMDLNYLRQPFMGETNLYWIILHELSHVLGAGTFWNYIPMGKNYKLITLDETNGAQYFGPNALREYARYIGNYAKAVPIQTRYQLDQPNASYTDRSITITQTRTITGTEEVNGFMLIDDPWGPNNLKKTISATSGQTLTYNIFLSWGGHLGETAPDLNPSVGGYTPGERTYANIVQPLIRPELSTPFYTESDGIEVSAITLAFLEDVGYTVDYSVL